MACHNGLVTPTGTDVSIGTDWRATMMANSSRDPYWQAAVRREIMDHPHATTEIEHECGLCHMPMPAFEKRTAGGKFGVFVNLGAPAAARDGMLAIDGVSCTTCHQITEKALGTKESFTGGFFIDRQTPIGTRKAFGPFAVDEGRRTTMRSASGFNPEQALHINNAELCATCHTLYTRPLDDRDHALGEFPEQVPYLEWRHSGFSKSRSCQSCHMRRFEKMPIASVLGQERDHLAQHLFRGGNFFVPRIFVRHQDQAPTAALTRELNGASQETIGHLQSNAARISIANVRLSSEGLSAEVAIRNLAGHKLPTAYPSRRAWIHLTVRDARGELVFESGAFKPDGSIHGNDNDRDPGIYEPHYREIDRADKVQIYESIMEDANGRITTALLKGVRYAKDNRVLPMGFDKTTAVPDIAVQGDAREDDDFGAGGDRVRYVMKVKPGSGPFTLQAELWYQPIAYRWAQNLRQRPAVETDRFVSFYDSLAEASAVVLAQTSEKAQ